MFWVAFLLSNHGPSYNIPSSYSIPSHVLQADRLNQHTALLDNHFNAEMATSPNVVLESRHRRIMQWDDHQWIRRQR
jgi:hypothetical protein